MADISQCKETDATFSPIWGTNARPAIASTDYWLQPIEWNRWAKQGICAHCHGWPRAIAGRCSRCGGSGIVPPYRPRVFCVLLADVFDDWTGDIYDHLGRRMWVDRAKGTDWQSESPHWSFSHHRPARMSDLRRRLFSLIDSTPSLAWLLLITRDGREWSEYPMRSEVACG